MHLKIFLASYCVLIALSGFSAENVKKTLYETKDGALDGANVLCSRSKMHAIQNAVPKQFPFVVAVMSHEGEYLCSGSIVSNGIVLTAASCLRKPIDYVLINATTTEEPAQNQKLRVVLTEKFASQDIGLIFTEKSNNVAAIKLSGKEKAITDLEAIGFGLNSEVGQPRQLQYVGVEARGDRDMLNAYLDCVETDTPQCFRDVGGPAVSGNKLAGVVVWGEEDCSKLSGNAKAMVNIVPSYVFKAWVDERILKEGLFAFANSASRSRQAREAAAATTTTAASKKTGNNLKYSKFLLLGWLPILATLF